MNAGKGDSLFLLVLLHSFIDGSWHAPVEKHMGSTHHSTMETEVGLT